MGCPITQRKLCMIFTCMQHYIDSKLVVSCFISLKICHQKIFCNVPSIESDIWGDYPLSPHMIKGSLEKNSQGLNAEADVFTPSDYHIPAFDWMT